MHAVFLVTSKTMRCGTQCPTVSGRVPCCELASMAATVKGQQCFQPCIVIGVFLPLPWISQAAGTEMFELVLNFQLEISLFIQCSLSRAIFKEHEVPAQHSTFYSASS